MIIYFLYILLALTSIYLILIMPKIINRPDITKFMGRLYAHRGLHQGKSIPENSLAAFKLAVENNYGIELDVQLSMDGVPVVFHDDNLKRVCGIDRKVKDLNFDELRELTLYDSKEKIPHFQEVLDLVDGKVPLIVEIKSSNASDREALSCNTIAPYLDKYNGVYCVESFNPIVVLWYKNNRPSVVRGQLATKSINKKPTFKNRLLNFTLRNLLFNFLAKPDFIAYNHKNSSLVSYNLCRTLYKPLTVAYTIQSQEDLEKNEDKFDLFIFDNFIPLEK
ncbi:MAG: glycerophosphodiester phosphodiesterase family protein [Tissierellaceae bacterium]|nr:glycerophosphodiester phosphodiesterase family protein [Tissierellaceae bacterium]